MCDVLYPIGTMLLVIYSYYVYVVEVCIFLTLEDQSKLVAYLTCYHVLLIMFLAMFFTAMFHRRFHVPEDFWIPPQIYEQVDSARDAKQEYEVLLRFCQAAGIKVYMRTSSGGIRYCQICQLVKPDRAHHCSTCETCVLKLDHHCPWINNCVGFNNYKYFMMCLLYSTLYCFFYCGTCIEYCIAFVNNVNYTKNLRQINIFIMAIITFVIGVVILSLFIFHLHLICTNQTTLESMHSPYFSGPYPIGFDKGCAANFEDVCTCIPCLWFLPVQTVDGDGTEFDIVIL